MIRNLIVLTVIVLLCAAPVLAQDTDSFPPEMLELVEAHMNRSTANQRPPGMIVWVDAPGLRYEGASGYAHLDGEILMQPEHAIKVGSITKMFTATVILQLVEEGTLALDDPLTKWLPGMAAGFTYGDQIMIGQLLNHTSGLDNYGLHPDLYSDVFAEFTFDLERLTVASDCSPLSMAGIMAAYAFEQPALFEPGEGTRYAYSNTGYIVLGLIIEAATGNSLVYEYHTRIIDPVGMISTYLECYEDPVGDLAGGYENWDGIQLDVSQVGTGALAWSAGGMVSTAPDLLLFTRALFGGKLFADAATLNMMVQPIPLYHYGMGMQVEDDNWGHDGSIEGYRSALHYWPEIDTVIVVLYNRRINLNLTKMTALRYTKLALVQAARSD